ncbi:unnamed protein product [Phytophthora fragariaefolia]|uniref:Unnamed protein product n=1 Tax=Phytophthora fragariaefolia TaxID=1490495 RepID=A0A9W6XZ46_9STRA|nr:unnamed protein product [Phytophthora fragariaefolia]
MPKHIAWQCTAVGVDGASADAVLDGMESFEITKSNKMAYTTCPDLDPHQMHFRLLECCSQSCESASEFACSWRGKMVTYLKTDEISIYTVGEHTSETPFPTKKKLTGSQKALCRDLVEHHLHPIRIRSAMSRRFGTPLHDLPALSTVQNFMNYHARAHLGNNGRVDDVRERVHAHAYTGEEGMTQPFTFGWDLGCEGKSIVGNGSDERPFIVGLSSKALVMRMMLPPGRFILHVDATTN